MTPKVNPESIKNLKPRYAPDKPGETVSLGVRVRLEQREALNKLCAQRGVAIGVLIREALDKYLSSESTATVETTPGLDTVEVVGLLEDALNMTKVKDIKAIIGKLWEMFTTGAGETVLQNEASPTPLDNPPVDNRKLKE